MEIKSAFRPFLAPSLILFILGWGGLAVVLFLTSPTIWPRWGFFALWTIAWVGTSLPIIFFLNFRFQSDQPAGPGVILRQSIWVGIYAATLAWMQLGRFASIWIAIGLAMGMIAIEYFIRMREQSQWRPPEAIEEPLSLENSQADD